jgi:hypothetical protein
MSASSWPTPSAPTTRLATPTLAPSSSADSAMTGEIAPCPSP